MKSLLRAVCVCSVSVCIMLLMSQSVFPRKTNVFYTDTSAFVVLELFTSQGCSSCPPADDTIAKLASDYGDNIYVLGFHVDYWDRPAWKDEFSNAAYTVRQKQYAEHLTLNLLYTPQVIVNGKKEFVGSDAKNIRNEVETELKTVSNTQIALSARSVDPGTITVLYKTNGAENSFLNIALVRLRSTGKVKGGENAGKRLKYINTVRDFITTANKTGVAELHLPAGSPAREYIVIAFLQDKITWNILGVKKAGID